MSNIIEEATIINSVTGNPLLRTSVLCKSIIVNFFSVIRIKDEENEELPKAEVLVLAKLPL